MKQYKILLIIGIVFLFNTAVRSQESWIAPEEARQNKNPIIINASIFEEGEMVYDKNCKSCHGIPGENNPLKMEPLPPDLSTEEVIKQTDGEIFYKITTGKGAMPAFAESLISEDKKWSLIHYIKNAKDGFTEIGDATDLSKLKNVAFNISLNDSMHSILAILQGVNEAGEQIAIEGHKVNFYVKRYFGELPVGKKNQKTNANGAVQITFPDDLPGDTIGNLTLIVKMDNKSYPDIKLEKELNWGVPTIPEDIMEGPAMWGTRDMAPWWIVALYLGIALSVWSSILYVCFQIFKIYKLGKLK